MKPAWPAEPTLSISTFLTETLQVTPSYIRIIKQGCFFLADMLPVKVLMSILYSRGRQPFECSVPVYE